MHTTRTTKLLLHGFTLLAALLLTLCPGAAAWADDNPGQAPVYTVTLPAATDGGAVTADRTEAAEGETVVLTVSPGHELYTAAERTARQLHGQQRAADGGAHPRHGREREHLDLYHARL